MFDILIRSDARYNEFFYGLLNRVRKERADKQRSFLLVDTLADHKWDMRTQRYLKGRRIKIFILDEEERSFTKLRSRWETILQLWEKEKTGK
jgi:hypothetical protein